MSHLTDEQRYTIQSLLGLGFNYSQIADTIGKHKSVISREVVRNCDLRSSTYSAKLAIKKCKERHKKKTKHQRFTPDVLTYVKSQIEKNISPEQIIGRAKMEGIECVSHESIYQYIWLDKKKGGKLFEHLRSKGKKYRRRSSAKDSRGLIKNATSIDERPTIVEEKIRPGDMEVDLVMGANHKSAIVTMNDRYLGIVKIVKVSSKEANEVKEAIINALTPWKSFIKTITSDNGKEFACHEEISKALNVQYYFAHPYCSWERGANENLNGLIRQYFPKKTDFSKITDEKIKIVEENLNNRPRKRFNFATPNEIFNQNVAFMT